LQAPFRTAFWAASTQAERNKKKSFEHGLNSQVVGPLRFAHLLQLTAQYNHQGTKVLLCAMQGLTCDLRDDCGLRPVGSL